MRYLITGGAGFIGSHLAARLLADGHHVIILERGVVQRAENKALAKAERRFGSVTDPDFVHRCMAGCDAVFHMASVLDVDKNNDRPVDKIETELMGVRNIAQAALDLGNIPIAYASSAGVYGARSLQRGTAEDFTATPITNYALSKRFNEVYLKAQAEQNGLTCVILRYFNVYGPGQRENMVIPRFFRQAMANEPITVHGSGRQTRDFVYVDDAVEATIKAQQLGRGCEIYNICTEQEWTVRDVAEMIIDITGSKSELISSLTPEEMNIEVDPRAGKADKLRGLIGDIPSTPLRDGLVKIFERIRQQVQPAPAA